MELLLTNRRLSAEQALEWGLVSEVVPAEDLLDRACGLAASLVRVPAQTLLATRRLLDAVGAEDLPSHLQREALALRGAARHPHFRAALRAFLDQHP
jgi:2-(1,2-epoxy-1,2-dihydrophenyl)acetyl-CoA isomerase